MKPSCSHRIKSSSTSCFWPSYLTIWPPCNWIITPVVWYEPKHFYCLLPTGVFKSLLTLLSIAVIPLIYYGMVIGWGVAMTQNGQNMNQAGQSISLYPMTPKRSLLLESISIVFFLMGNNGTKIIFFYFLCCILILLVDG